MSSIRTRKTHTRDVNGLCDALFDEIEDLRAGVSGPHEAIAVCSLAERVLDTIEMRMKMVSFTLSIKERKQQLAECKQGLLENRVSKTREEDNEVYEVQ